MAQNIGHSGLVKLFGRSAIQVPAEENKENDEDNDYKQSNKSLVSKNVALKAEITKLKKRIEELHQENLQKDEKIALLESNMDEAKIDFLVAERFKRKMNHMNAILERTILNMSKSAEEIRAVMCDMKSSVEPTLVPPSLLPQSLQQKTTAPHPKAMSLPSKPSLDRITESPLVRGQRSVLAGQPGTPRAANITIRRTPKTGRKPAGSDNSVSNIGATPRRVRSTPSRSGDMAAEQDTVRRKRAAASRITSFAEPSLNTKLRRPDKYDEPTPYISTDFI